MEQELTEILGLLASAPEGLSALAVRARLREPVSQPTIWRRLEALRARGLVTVEGRARATRYHASARAGAGALRSRRLHEAVAHRLVRDPSVLASARERLEKLRAVNPHGRTYHERWRDLMAGPRERLLKVMTEDSETADALRKESPFTALVKPDERRRVLRALRAA